MNQGEQLAQIRPGGSLYTGPDPGAQKAFIYILTIYFYTAARTAARGKNRTGRGCGDFV